MYFLFCLARGFGYTVTGALITQVPVYGIFYVTIRVYDILFFLDFRYSVHKHGNFGPKLNGSVRSNRKSFEKTGPPFEVVLFARSDRLEFWLNGSRPREKSKVISGETSLNLLAQERVCGLHIGEFKINDETAATTPQNLHT